MDAATPRRDDPLADPVVHDRVRLAILTSLASEQPLSFTALRQRLGLTDGNLSVHARRLEEVGYVAASRLGQRPARRTEFRLTPAGRRALLRYAEYLETVVSSIRRLTPPDGPAAP